MLPPDQPARTTVTLRAAHTSICREGADLITALTGALAVPAAAMPRVQAAIAALRVGP